MKDLTPAVAQLACTYGLAEVYVFGSRAREIAARARKGIVPKKRSLSDVDIAIRPLPAALLSARDLANLTSELEDLFEVNRVDLVLLPGADPFLALDIIRGELLYAADPTDQALYELYVLRRAGDLSPFKKAQIELVLQGQSK